MKTIFEQIKDRCVHYNGFQKGHCRYGVNYRNLASGPDLGWAARLPCVVNSPLTKQPVPECQAFRLPNDHEARIESEKFEALVRDVIGKGGGEK